ILFFVFFFFQAEDGIRDKLVTGVQTCALPILVCKGRDFSSRRDTAIIRVLFDIGARLSEVANLTLDDVDLDVDVIHVLGKGRRRSEERRVGKEWRSGWAAEY